MAEQRDSLVVVDQDGDVELLVQNRRFLVRSSKMSALSPVFQEIFHQPRARTIALSSKDSEAFHQICLSAHGFVVPQTDIPTDTLANMADAIARYNICIGSTVHYTVFFSFVTQAVKPEAIPVSKILKLIQVAKILGPTIFKEFIKAIFLLRSFQWERLPVAHEPRFSDSAIILANVCVKAAECRANVTRILLNTLKFSRESHNPDSYRLARFIVNEHPSLNEIGSRLRSIQSSGERQAGGLLEAQQAIVKATVAMNNYSGTVIGQEVEDKRYTTRESLELRAFYKPEFNRLQIKRAKEQNRTFSWMSSNSTNFEDISTYFQTVDEGMATYSDNDESILGRL